jgi:hypothetical protein
MNVKGLHGRDKRHKTYNMYCFVDDAPDSNVLSKDEADQNPFLSSFLVTRASTQYDAEWVAETELFCMTDGPGSAVRGRDLGPERPCVLVCCARWHWA